MKDIVVSTLTIVLLVFVLSLQLLSGGGESPAPIPAEQVRTLAAALDSQGLHKQAVAEFRRYLDIARIPPQQRANILYHIGTTYLDQLEDYENALAAFIELSHLYPTSPVTRDAEKRMIKCYEGMRRGFDAQKKLRQLTDLEPDAEPQGEGPVVAQIGDRKITLDQIERDLEQKGEYYQKNFATPEKKLEYLKTMIFTDLLADAARRKEYNRDAEIRRQVRNFEKEILAAKVYNEEVRQKIETKPDDLELYYKAHQSEFVESKTVTVAHIQVDSQERAAEVKKALDEGMAFDEAAAQYSMDARTKNNGGMLGAVQGGRNFIPGVGQSPDLAAKLLALEKDAISEPLQSPNGYHLFRALEIKPEKQLSLQEARPRVEALVNQMKEQALQKELLERMMQAEKVNIFDDVLKRELPSTTQPSSPAGDL
ncbi:MAG: hypothetical protein C4527_02395 [Candidatus Omnitrophota bacterium]|jgi:parvulin-like peptidyl-prolyl isomerase|nr:MAG: hypothetical protein C4527_02395 [Candidatus Omnitrophota bacterium]